MSLHELSEKADITISNLSIFKTGRAKALRLSTLDATCKALNCQPAGILAIPRKGLPVDRPECINISLRTLIPATTNKVYIVHGE